MRFLIPFVLAAVFLAACKDVAPGEKQSFVRGSGDVAVKQYKLVDPGDSASGGIGGGAVIYVICQIEFTNDIKADYTPTMSSFVLTDTNGNRYRAIDSGSVATIGISNYGGPVKKDEKQLYTVAFRVPPNTGGFISYELIQ